ncbi:hypothetical protein DC28_05210 [Spirochaeta lutea]|uniref:Uncharacterized protein n=1 Tax=Spirochaeta lutea TaxID=1480694 RepID=A0A098R087_9SPIO|nr:hypothetical protein DC28_05210 [Spirochaeta lutea]
MYVRFAATFMILLKAIRTTALNQEHPSKRSPKTGFVPCAVQVRKISHLKNRGRIITLDLGTGLQ